jgi:hypothetical protein
MTFRPDWLSRPGETIADVLEERALSSSELARRRSPVIEPAKPQARL